MKIEHLLAVILSAALLSPSFGLAAEKPNIILIFADDLGWQEPSYAGSDLNETPHIDRLSKEGMVFTQAYATAGNCAPSRASLISGQYTPRHGVYAVDSTNRGAVELMRMTPVPNVSGINAAQFTLPKALKSAGYVTGMFGKWHLDGPDGSSPKKHFDVVDLAAVGWNQQVAGDPKGIFSITKSACEFIEANKDRPFFLYLPHYAIHSVLQSRDEVLQKFQQKPAGKLHRNAKNAACLAELDTGVGLLLKKLADLGLEKNTLVAFTSDNGGYHELQEPLRGKKGCYYEGGIRVPMIVRWPSVVKAGATCAVPVINVDFYATFAALAGAKLPSDLPMDGENLQPLLEGRSKLQRQAIFWHFPGYLEDPVPRGRDRDFRTRPISVIRKGDWKLHLFHEEWLLDGGREKLATNRAVELYHIVEDQGEHKDRAATDPTKRDELLADLLAWISKVPAPLPTRIAKDGGKER